MSQVPYKPHSMALTTGVLQAGEEALHKVLSHPFTPQEIVKQVFWAMRQRQLDEKKQYG